MTDYVNFIKQYKEDTATLKNAEKLKKCADDKFTEEDKESIKSLLVSLCVSGPGACLPICSPRVRDGDYPSLPPQLLCESRNMTLPTEFHEVGAGRDTQAASAGPGSSVQLSQARPSRIPGPQHHSASISLSGPASRVQPHQHRAWHPFPSLDLLS